jgi:small ligand-binding sensory domain FIST
MHRPFAAAMSVSTDPATAAGETIGAVLEQLAGSRPDLAVLFVAGTHVEHMDDLVSAVNATLRPETLLAMSAVGVVGGGREVERGPGVSLWAGATGPVRGVRMEALDRSTVLGCPDDLRTGETLLMVADPYSFPVERLFDDLPAGVGVVGGLASAAGEPGGNRLWLDGAEYRDGAVGVVFPPGTVTTIVSQGCRPVGQPWVVTRSNQGLIHELAGRPAIERLNRVIESLSPKDRLAASRGLHLGIVANDLADEFTQGDFLIRGVMGIEQSTRAVAVGDAVEVGQVVQFQVRDPDSAGIDLVEMLGADGPGIQGALVFTCNGRGTRLFGEPHHDAERVTEVTEGGVAGMFCAGELGPIGARNAVHGFTATVVAFRQLP